MGYLLSGYVAISIAAFAASVYQLYGRYDNYFAFALAYWSDPLTNILFCNAYLSIMLALQRIVIASFFGEMKEGELIKIKDKLKMKTLEFMIILFIYYNDLNLVYFLLTVLLLLSFVLHHLMMLRSEYLTNTHSPSLKEPLKVLAFFLALLFIDFQTVRFCYDWFLFKAQLPLIFSFYVLQMSLQSLEPFIKLIAHIYERFTLYEFRNLDYRLSVLGFAINLPRLLLLIVFVLNFIMSQHGLFFIFMLLELLVELVQLIKGFRKMKELTQTMDHLPKVEPPEMKQEEDNICMVCFREMEEGRRLPCKHVFHEECLKQWIQKNTNHFCPKCKRPFDFNKPTDKKPPLVQAAEHVHPEFTVKKHLIIDRVFLPEPNLGKASEVEEDQPAPESHPSEKAEEPPCLSQEQPPALQAAPLPQSEPGEWLRIGSLPSCLPTEAVYNRTSEHFSLRKRMKLFNLYLTSTLAYPPRLQMLIIPE